MKILKKLLNNLPKTKREEELELENEILTHRLNTHIEMLEDKRKMWVEEFRENLDLRDLLNITLRKCKEEGVTFNLEETTRIRSYLPK